MRVKPPIYSIYRPVRRNRRNVCQKKPLVMRLLRFVTRAVSGFVLLLLFGFGFRQVEGLWQVPQAVLVLGGATEREQFAAEFAKQHPHLPVWISSGSNPEYAEWLFTEAGIEPTRVHLDYQAVDTVTNFTTLADAFKTQNIQSVYLITSDYHMRRAQVIGEIVLGSRGIDFRPVTVPSNKAPESIKKVLRDGVRAVLWVITGETGSRLASRFRASR
jgi:uncharacterized SAM-binding protein YcdF (DUF218 family)